MVEGTRRSRAADFLENRLLHVGDREEFFAAVDTDVASGALTQETAALVKKGFRIVVQATRLNNRRARLGLKRAKLFAALAE